MSTPDHTGTHGHQHTIHRAHIHHGWDNSFAPRLRIVPGESIQFETVDASSGQLNRTSTAADLARLDLARVNPVTGPVFIVEIFTEEVRQLLHGKSKNVYRVLFVIRDSNVYVL